MGASTARTYYGGLNGAGTVFKVDASGTLTTLHSFDYANEGGHPYAGLVQSSDGSFYGTTYQGGPNGVGTVFKVDATGTLTMLHSFDYASEGGYPYAGLVQSTDGSFYGTTYQGGPSGYGTIFRVNAAGTFTTLHSFDYSHEGAYPLAALVQGSDGSFYGTAYQGGPNGWGTVFKVDAAGTLTVLHAFGYRDGGSPWAGLVQSTDGSFYGTTYQGGPYNYGTIFSVNAAGAFTSLHDFAYGDGGYPIAGLVQGRDGAFYGTTSYGGNGYGTVFRVDGAGTLTMLHALNYGDGGYPWAGFVRDSDGRLYGTMYAGGASGSGTVVRLTIVSEPQRRPCCWRHRPPGHSAARLRCPRRSPLPARRSPAVASRSR